MAVKERICKLWLVACVCSFFIQTTHAGTWGRDYFPNVPLTTHNGEQVRFFDDLIEDKIVVINFIYTTCPDTCPLETAKLVSVQQILKDRIGKDVFFYSISIDPEHDTPDVLKEYRERFKADWTFLTGKDSDIVSLRKKLGLFIPEIPDDSSNHNVNMIIGNQATGRWMKRSPFENAHVLADQIGNWLDGWKRPPQWNNYIDAPKLRDVPLGEQLYRTRCASCHSLEGQDPEGALGPDLFGVTQRRDMDWIMNWLRAPDQMLSKKDPIAVALFEKYNKLPMPNFRLNKEECLAIVDYIKSIKEPIKNPLLNGTNQDGAGLSNVNVRSFEQDSSKEVLAILDPWVREAHPAASINAGYLTLVNVSDNDRILIGVESPQFEKVELHEMAKVDGLMKMRALPELVVPSKGVELLKPRGKHLMLKGRKVSLVAGNQVKLVLEFKSGEKQSIIANVRGQ
jgi:protein SCO1/2